MTPMRPNRREAAIARGLVHEAASTWSPHDVVRLAALIKLGKPGTVVSSVPAIVDTERGEEKWGTLGLRPRATSETARRAAALHMWRLVAAAAGWPLASPHALIVPEEPTTGDDEPLPAPVDWEDRAAIVRAMIPGTAAEKALLQRVAAILDGEA